MYFIVFQKQINFYYKTGKQLCWKLCSTYCFLFLLDHYFDKLMSSGLIWFFDLWKKIALGITIIILLSTNGLEEEPQHEYSIYFCHGLRRRLKAMALLPPFRKVTDWSSNELTRTNMSALACNCSRALWKYIYHLDSCDIGYSSDSRQFVSAIGNI